MKRSELVKETAERTAEEVKVKLIGEAPQDYWRHEQGLIAIIEFNILKLLADLQ